MADSPYYQGMGVTLYHGDARDIIPSLPNVDLVASDPPYGQSYQSNRRNDAMRAIAGDENTDVGMDVLMLLPLVLRRGRHMYYFGRWDLAGTRFCESAELIWDKMKFGSGDLASPWGSAHEVITFAVYELSKANREKGHGRLAARIRKGSVLRHPRPNGSGVTRHPTEKPVGLMRELIESSSCFGELVLDPFVGSGSTLEAAVLEGRSAIGIEVDERYCEITAKRIEAINGR